MPWATLSRVSKPYQLTPEIVNWPPAGPTMLVPLVDQPAAAVVATFAASRQQAARRPTAVGSRRSTRMGFTSVMLRTWDGPPPRSGAAEGCSGAPGRRDQLPNVGGCGRALRLTILLSA